MKFLLLGLFSLPAFAQMNCAGAPGTIHTNPDSNPGGFVASTAYVAPTVFLASGSEVCQTAKVLGSVNINGVSRILNAAQIESGAGNTVYVEDAIIRGNAFVGLGTISVRWGAQVRDFARVTGNTYIAGTTAGDTVGPIIEGNAQVSGANILNRARISEDAVITGGEVRDFARIYGSANLTDYVQVYGNAEVYERARVSNGAQIYGLGKVHGEAQVYDSAKVYGNGEVMDFATINYDTVVRDNAKVYGSAVVVVSSQGNGERGVFNDARVHGNARVFSSSIVQDKAQVFGNSQINNTTVKNQGLVSGNANMNSAIIQDKAIVKGYSYINGGKVSDEGQVYGNATLDNGAPHVTGAAQVFGYARIEGNGIMRDRTQAYGNAIVRGLVKHSSQVFGNAVIEPTGELNGTATIHGSAVITTVIYNQDISQ